MNELIFASGNNQKFLMAELACKKYNIALTQDASLRIAEIQGETGEPIARHKANEAFRLLQAPVIITDDTWQIPGLGGFPGPYMKSIDYWFKTEDWVRLTHDLTDRRVILNQILVYQDELEQVLFELPIEGILLQEPRGSSSKTNQPIVSFDGGEHSVAEIFASGASALAGRHNAWDEFGAWFQSRSS